MKVFNKQISEHWEKFRPQIEAEIKQKLLSLVGTQLNNNLSITEVKWPWVDIVKPIGFTTLNPFEINFRAPLKGKWEFGATVRVKYKKKIWFFTITTYHTIGLHVTDIWLQTKIKLDPLTDPERPKIVGTEPKVNFKVILYGQNWLTKLILWILKPKINAKVEETRQKIQDWLASQLNTFVSSLPPIIGLGGPALSSTNLSSSEMMQKVLAVENKLQSDMMPYGTVFDGIYSLPGEGQGQVCDWAEFGDSAIWTGTYLIGASLRYHLTNSPQALNYVKKAVKGIDRLFRIAKPHKEGLLARCAVPLNSTIAQKILQTCNPPFYQAYFDGEWWIGTGRHFISRDQYLGALVGMWVAYSLVNDPYVKETTKYWLSTAVKMIVDNKWFVQPPGGKPVTYLGVFYQQLALLHMARYMNPNNSYFQSALNNHSPLSELVWFSFWTNTFDQHNEYYKFNLAHTGMFALMKLETNILRWLHYYYAFRILRKPLRHHQNAWFNAIEMWCLPWTMSNSQFVHETIEYLRRAMIRSRRYVVPDQGFLNSVEKILYTPPGASTGIWIAKYHIPPDKRLPTDFLWQRSPFQIGSYNNPYQEAPGVDLITPYWLLRHLGVIN